MKRIINDLLEIGRVGRGVHVMKITSLHESVCCEPIYSEATLLLTFPFTRWQE